MYHLLNNYVGYLHFHRQWPQTAIFLTSNLKCLWGVHAGFDITAALFLESSFNHSFSAHNLILIYELHWMQFWLLTL